eukprot:1156408-Pelagomonas_calceolata.AAC.7
MHLHQHAQPKSCTPVRPPRCVQLLYSFQQLCHKVSAEVLSGSAACKDTSMGEQKFIKAYALLRFCAEVLSGSTACEDASTDETNKLQETWALVSILFDRS